MVLRIRFGNNDAVHVGAERGDGTRTARVDDGDDARIAFRFVNEGLRHAVGFGAFNGFGHELRVAAHDGIGIDHLQAEERLEAERTQTLRNEPARFEFRPAFFRHLMDLAAGRNHFFDVLRFRECSHGVNSLSLLEAECLWTQSVRNLSASGSQGLS